MATLVIRIRDIDYYPQEEWDYGSVLAKRRWYIKTLPINSPEITKLDVWLLNQPDLHPDDMIDIWSRTMYCFWLAYRDPEVDKLTKHFMLLALKEEFEEYCRLSEFDQERLWPNWAKWKATFVTEEGIASGRIQILSRGRVMREPTAAQALYQRRLRRQLDPFNWGPLA